MQADTTDRNDENVAVAVGYCIYLCLRLNETMKSTLKNGWNSWHAQWWIWFYVYCWTITHVKTEIKKIFFFLFTWFIFSTKVLQYLKIDQSEHRIRINIVPNQIQLEFLQKKNLMSNWMCRFAHQFRLLLVIRRFFSPQGASMRHVE